jgi:hypothetical protein
MRGPFENVTVENLEGRRGDRNDSLLSSFCLVDPDEWLFR